MKYYYAEIHFKNTDGSNYYVGGKKGDIIEWDDDYCLFTNKDKLWQAIDNLEKNAKEQGIWDEIDWIERGSVEKWKTKSIRKT